MANESKDLSREKMKTDDMRALTFVHIIIISSFFYIFIFDFNLGAVPCVAFPKPMPVIYPSV